MYETFPRMRSLHFQSPTGPTECQDLLGMDFRTAHFDGMARVPSYTRLGRRLRHDARLCVPPARAAAAAVALPAAAVASEDPGAHARARRPATRPTRSAKFLWTHRDPAAVLGSVCSLIAYTRSWASDGDDAEELGREQLVFWAEAIGRALDFRNRAGEGCFADISHAELQTDPVGALAAAYERLGLDFAGGRGPVEAWARDHRPGAHGVHEFLLDDFGLDAGAVRARFAAYLDRFPTD